METQKISEKDLKFFVGTLYPYKGLDEMPRHICLDIMDIRGADDVKACERDVKAAIKEEYRRDEPDW